MVFLQRKAVYNLIQLNLNKGHTPSGELQPWQMENYREQPTEALFQRLERLNIPLQSQDLELYGKQLEAPEDLAEKLAVQRDPLEQDQIYLILFELWRRFFPEKRSLSVFCDELDYQMSQYDMGYECTIDDTLSYLHQLLEAHVDQGFQPKEALEEIQTYCANDIEGFLYDYILDTIHEGNYDYAVELLEDFFHYTREKLWFEYLAARTEMLEDPEEGFDLFELVIKKVHESSPLDLVEDMLYYLATVGHHTLFHHLSERAYPLLATEEDFHEFLEISYVLFDELDLSKESEQIAEIFHRRKDNPLNTPLAPTDPDLATLKSLISLV